MIVLRLPHRAPLHAEALFGFLGARAIPGVEALDTMGYRRGLRLPHGPATVTLAPREGYVQATLRLTQLRDLAPTVARCRRMLDLDADPEAIDAVLAADPALAASVAAEPGVRLPRAADGFELAVRGIVGQQISVSAARTVLGKLVAAAPAGPAGSAGPQSQPTEPDLGGTAEPFPTAQQVLALPDEAFAMPGARRRTILALAEAVASGEVLLDGGADRADTEARLLAVPGIGAWTASYVTLRALGDPDVFLPTDLGVRRGAAALGLPDDPVALADYAKHWAPWRSYAVIRLWRHA
jgi:AraC family transcriptional regulator of adaptative response / DNA-3-methyladenine glycosylase II